MAVTCPSCAADNPEGKRFCADCGHGDEQAPGMDEAHRGMGTEDDFALRLPLGVEGGLAVGDVPEAERLLDYIADEAPGRVTPLARMHFLRLRALVGSARGDAPAAVDANL